MFKYLLLEANEMKYFPISIVSIIIQYFFYFYNKEANQHDILRCRSASCSWKYSGCMVFLCSENDEPKRKTFPHTWQWCVPAEPVWICVCSWNTDRHGKLWSDSLFPPSATKCIPEVWFCLWNPCRTPDIWTFPSVRECAFAYVCSTNVDWAKCDRTPDTLAVLACVRVNASPELHDSCSCEKKNSVIHVE